MKRTQEIINLLLVIRKGISGHMTFEMKLEWQNLAKALETHVFFKLRE